MSSTDLEIHELVPGDFVVAVHEMRAWESEDKRGWSDHWIRQGEQATVIGTWLVGNQLRVRVFRDNRFHLFSCAAHCVFKNWKVVNAAPRLPTSGCP